VTVNSSLFSCTRIVHRTPVVETKKLHADYNLNRLQLSNHFGFSSEEQFIVVLPTVGVCCSSIW
jgi:hypothetical protein